MCVPGQSAAPGASVILRDTHCAFPGCVHQWGWTLVLSADGTTTAVSPNRTRTPRSHGPSSAA